MDERLESGDNPDWITLEDMVRRFGAQAVIDAATTIGEQSEDICDNIIEK